MFNESVNFISVMIVFHGLFSNMEVNAIYASDYGSDGGNVCQYDEDAACRNQYDSATWGKCRNMVVEFDDGEAKVETIACCNSKNYLVGCLHNVHGIGTIDCRTK